MSETAAARIAFVGAGNHATQSLYPNIAHIPEFDLVAVCDTQADRAAYAARKFGALACFTDLDTMLEEARPQGVCIVGPPQMHHELALRVLERGIPAFVEKPPAPTLGQVRELADTARARGVWGMVGFMKRFAPANVVAKEFMGGESFGRLSSITLMHGSGPYDDTRRMLLFNGIHMLDLARFLAGEVEELFAYGSPASAGVQAASVAMRFAGGPVGQLNMNSGHVWPDTFEQVYLSGDSAGVLIDGSRTVDVMAPDRRFARGEGLQLCGWSSRYYVSGNLAGWPSGGHYTRGYWGELNHFARAVLGQVEPTPTLDDGVAAMQMVDAIMESVASGRPVVV